MWKRIEITIAIFALVCADAFGDSLLLPSFFSDNMILQRGPEQARIWGKSTCAESVKVSVKNKYGQVVALGHPPLVSGENNDEWEVLLPAQEASVDNSVELVDCVERKTFENVLFGDVFLCSGQSNMEFAVAGDYTGNETISASKIDKYIRHWSASRQRKDTPQFDIPARTPHNGWLINQPSSFGHDFFSFPSAVCYYTARTIYRYFDGKVPIGFVGSYFGGQPVEDFSSPEAMNDKTCGGTKRAANLTRSSLSGNEGTLWNGLIYPLRKLKLKSMMWYQGEANVQNAVSYGCRFPAMIVDWRQKFESDEVPFFFVLLAGYKTANFVDVRYSQMAALALRNVGVALAIDVGSRTDIHPRNKLIVGHRLALGLLRTAYGEHDLVVSSTGPVFQKASFDSHDFSVLISFVTGTAKSIQFHPTLDCTVCCSQSPFEVQLSNSSWIRATGRINSLDEKITLQLSMKDVGLSPPLALRYNWEAFPECSLQSNFGGFTGMLPALPFNATLVSF